MPESATALRMTEWSELSPSTHEQLRGLNFSSQRARDEAEGLASERKLIAEELRTGLRVSATSYVGRVALGDITITVRPKVDRVPLNTLFGYAYGIRNLHILSGADQYVDDAEFVDLIVQQVIHEARELLSRGLKRAYKRREEELGSPRGRFDLRRIATRPATTARVPCIHYPRDWNCLANRVLLRGLSVSAALAEDARLRGEARTLHAQVRDIAQCGYAEAHEVARFIWECDRLSVAYLPVARLTMLLMEGCGVSLSGARRTEHLRGFLFDMNRFFQELVSRLLHDGLPGCAVVDEHRLRHMLRYTGTAAGHRRNDPTPRPDFVVSWPGGQRLILDAKYRDIWDTGLPRDMLYQLCIYALSGISNGTAVIVYPTTSHVAQEQCVEIQNPMTGARLGEVLLRPLNLVELAGAVDTMVSGTTTAHIRRTAEVLTTGRSCG